MDEEIRVAAGRSRDEPGKKSKSRRNKKKKTVEQSVDDIKQLNSDVVAAEGSREVAPLSGKAQKRKSEFLAATLKSPKKKRGQKSECAEKPPIRSGGERIDESESFKEKTNRESAEKLTTVAEAAETVPWDQLTPKQKKNRRNAMIKKRKKMEQKQQRAEKIRTKELKFKPLEDLQISEARMRAYGLNPNRVKGDLVYGERKNKKQSS